MALLREERRRVREERKKKLPEERRKDPAKTRIRPARRVDIKRKLEVQGTVVSRVARLAIINDEAYQEGDSVLGATIREISSRRIVLEHKGKTIVKRVK
ncbi:MAG: hypothetical protein ABII00_15435 [Elusimicrobiota bacterium]